MKCPYDDNRIGVVVAYSDIYDLDTFTRDALAGEVSANFYPEALKANAVMIRSVAEFYARNPQSNWSSLCNLTGLSFNLRDSTMQGWTAGLGATGRGLDVNVPNDRVTDTGAQVIAQNQQLEFGPCLQNVSNDLAGQGLDYIAILTDPHQGIYSGNHCGYAAQPNLSILSAYSFRPSLTNGTTPRPVRGTQQTDQVTEVRQARQAEHFWGHSGMDKVLSHPFGQSGTYLSAWHPGDRVEYLMKFGDQADGDRFENLHLIGISDIPAPVRLNIYIDGYYRGSMQWAEGDNRRHLRVDKFLGIPWGSGDDDDGDPHAIGIEFANDYCV